MTDLSETIQGTKHTWRIEVTGREPGPDEDSLSRYIVVTATTDDPSETRSVELKMRPAENWLDLEGFVRIVKYDAKKDFYRG